jgi:hypothetical protein
MRFTVAFGVGAVGIPAVVLVSDRPTDAAASAQQDAASTAVRRERDVKLEERIGQRWWY